MIRTRRLQARFKLLALIIALAVGLLLPALSLFSAYQNRVGRIEGEARLAALAVTEFINTSGGLWRFQQERLKTVLTKTVSARHQVRVIANDGEEVAAIGPELSAYKVSRARDFLDFGQVAGRVEVSMALPGLLEDAMWSIVAGVGLGLAVFFPLRALPLRALDNAIRALSLSEERNRTVIATLSEGIMMVDRDGHILIANEAARAIFGENLADWLACRNTEAIVRDESGAALSDADHPVARAFAAGRESRNIVLRLACAEGDCPWILVNVQPLIDPDDGKAKAVVVSVIDISADRRREEDLARARDQAESASRAKSQFLANMSHEIRTPMNGVLGMAQLLAGDTSLNEKQRRYLGIILSSGESLMRVIDDVLDFSKIEAGRLGLNPEVFDLRERVAMTMRLMENRAHGKGLALTWKVDDAVPSWVKGDASRLHQVLANLVGNAIKFTEQGSVDTRVELCADPVQSEDMIRVCFSVSDTGIGIPADYMPNLFTLFSQADQSHSRRFGGTGLGLAISRELVVLMGGEISAESEPGQGATFRFNILLNRAEPPASAAVSRPRADADASATLTGRVLVVEDEPTNRMLAKAMLRVMGCTPEVTESGQEALDWLEREACDLILMDCQMPGLDGLETTAMIREREQLAGDGRHVPIIALTANALSGDRERCLEAGMDDYLSKPYTREALQEKLTQWLYREEGEPAVQA